MKHCVSVEKVTSEYLKGGLGKYQREKDVRQRAQPVQRPSGGSVPGVGKEEPGVGAGGHCRGRVDELRGVWQT